MLTRGEPSGILLCSIDLIGDVFKSLQRLGVRYAFRIALVDVVEKLIPQVSDSLNQVLPCESCRSWSMSAGLG